MWKVQQEYGSSEAEVGSMPTGDTDDSSSAGRENEKEEVEDGPPPPPEGQCTHRMLQTRIRQDHQDLCLKKRVLRPLVNGYQ